MFGSPPDDSSRGRRSPGTPPPAHPRPGGPPPGGGFPPAAGPPPASGFPPAAGPPPASGFPPGGGTPGGRPRPGGRAGTSDQGGQAGGPEPARRGSVPSARSHRDAGTAGGSRREEPTSRRARRALPAAEPDWDDELDVTDDGPELFEVPVRRTLSFSIAGFALLLGFGLVLGSETAGIGSARLTFGVVVFGAQLLYVLATTMAMRPPAHKVVAGVGLLAAAAADATSVYSDTATVAPLALVAAAGFVAGVIGQMVRRETRVRVTESLGATLVIVVGVVAFSTLIVLTRVPIGTQALVVCVSASAVALGVARLTDVALPWPRLAPQVPRGSIGIVLGAMIGTGVAAYLGSFLVGFTPGSAAKVGMVTAVAAVFADLTIGFAEAGRELAGDAPTLWLARHMQGPLAGFALAAPVAYLISVLFLVPV